MQKSAPVKTHVNPAQARPVWPLTIGAAALLILSLAVTVPYQSDWWKVLILGVVQGLSEFLPISSTGHLLITSSLLNYEGSMDGTFEIFIQFGTVLAVIGFYSADLLQQARACTGYGYTAEETHVARRFWLGILLAFIPAAVIGLAARDWIKTVLFDTPAVIAGSLIAGGFVFLLIERLPQHFATTSDLSQITFPQALSIGVAQVLALVPGVSRSGASIVGAMTARLDRRTATAFSFYLAIPTLGAATVVDLLSELARVTPDDVTRLLLGTVVSMIVGWLSIGWLLRYVASHNFVAFGIYRIIAGLVILGLIGAGYL